MFEYAFVLLVILFWLLIVVSLLIIFGIASIVILGTLIRLLRLGYTKVFFIYILLFIVMVAHPALLGRIISQVESPFVIRIGLVIIAYPTVLAVLWWCFLKMINDPHHDGYVIIYLLVISLLLLPTLIWGSMAGQELGLHNQLLQEGVAGLASIQKCEENKHSRGTSCYISYAYQVPLANKETKLYRVREQVNCNRVCKIGSSVDISYLPQTPTKVRIFGNRLALDSDFTGFAFWAICWFVIILAQSNQLLDKKHKE